MDAKEFVRIACSWASENRGVIWLICSDPLKRQVVALLRADGFDVFAGSTRNPRLCRGGFAVIEVFVSPVEPRTFQGLHLPDALLEFDGPFLTDEAEIGIRVRAPDLAVARDLASTQKPAPETFSGVPFSREVGAGTDPKTGLPVLDLDLAAWGMGKLRMLLDPDAAIRVGSALLAAADPTLVPRLLRLAARSEETGPEFVERRRLEAARKAQRWELGDPSAPGNAIQVREGGRTVWKLP